MESTGFSIQVDAQQLEKALETAQQLKLVLLEVHRLINSLGAGQTDQGITFNSFQSMP